MRFSISVLFALLLTFSLTTLHAQERTDYARMARPALDREYHGEREKRDEWRPYLLQGPISQETGFFLNRNLITDDGETPQNESSIAISPIDPSFLISSAVDSRPGAHIYMSYDGGHSWQNKFLGLVNVDWQSGNDPSVGFDHLGNAYLMYGAFPRPFTGESGVYIAKSTDKGENWTPHIIVIEHKGAMTLDSAFEDKYYIEIDRSTTSPYRGWMYTPWKRVTDRDSATQIVFTRSTDGGATWSTPIPISPRKSGTSKHITFGQSFPLVKTGPNGEIYGVWNDGPARSIGFAKSTDGGDTWSSPTYPVAGYEYLGTDRFFISSVTRIDTIDKGTPNERYDTVAVPDTTDRYHVLKKTFRAETYPTIAVDQSNSSRRGWVYLCWSARQEPDIFFIRSTDGGNTWSQPKVIQSETKNDQWWPWISVDETNGDIGVMYSDSRNDPENIMIDTYVSYSSDGGDTWIDRKATDAMSDFRDNPFVDQVFAGDYSGNAFHDGKIYPSFLDTRDDNDVYTAVVDIRQPYPVENFRVGSRLSDLTEATLRWENPPMVTLFGLPITDYTLVLERDGAVLAVLPAGTTQYVDPGLTTTQEYKYLIRVAVGGDTSVPRTVDFRSGGAKGAGQPIVESFKQYDPTIEFQLLVPGVRADSVTPFENLAGYRIYRDGVLLREVNLAPGDTGKVLTVEETPAERGYYRYTFSTVDGAQPPNESALSDTIVVYAGSLDDYQVTFDNTPHRFLTTGEWATTDALALSPPNSLTDSPGKDYASRRNSHTQVYPVQPTSAERTVSVEFSHICIVLPGDTASLEISYDTAKTWETVRRYQSTDRPEWNDRSADPGDWALEHVDIPTTANGLVFLRFRLASNALGTDDGWYVDDLSVRLVPLSVGEGVERTGTFSSAIYPNPTTGSAMLRFQLPSASTVRVQFYNQLGQQVRTIADQRFEAGPQGVGFNVGDLPSGAYFYSVETSFGTSRGTMMLSK